MDILVRANRQLAKTNMIKETMLQISNSIVQINNIDELLEQILEKAVLLIDNADNGSILLFQDDNKLAFHAVYGYDMQFLSSIRLSLEETYLYAYTEGQPLKACIIKNPENFNHAHMSKGNFHKFQNARALNIQSTICAPIMVDQELYGFINIDNISDENAFHEEDVRILEYLANQIGIAINNACLFEKTLQLSRYDSLTQVYSRSYFEELYQNIYKRAQRYHEHYTIAVIDLNNLKNINDRYGHMAGDLAIKLFSQVLKQNLRDSDIMGRYGGDEFLVVFLNSTYETTCHKLYEVLQILSQYPLYYEGHRFHVGFSYGVACFPSDSQDGQLLIKIADKRMYENKVHIKTTV
ncbi:MAG: sensor domain-containing diguanylate cyclase [Thermotaleaceae bacterium]